MSSLIVALLAADLPPCGIVLLVDYSGSISDSGVETAKEINRAFADAGYERATVAFFGRPMKHDGGLISWGVPPAKPFDCTPIPQVLDEVRADFASHTDGGRLVLIGLSDWREDPPSQSRVSRIDGGTERDAFFLLQPIRHEKNCGAQPRQLFPDARPAVATEVMRWLEDTVKSFCTIQREQVPITCSIPSPNTVAVGNEKGFRCSGAALDARTVLTAAHCLPATRVTMSLDASRSEVAVARSRRVDGTDSALLTLSADLGIDPDVSYVVSDREPFGAATALGFGTSAGAFGTKHSVPVAAQGWGCTGPDVFRTGCKPESEAFFPGSPGFDTCAGDSGGPIVQLWSEPFVSDGGCEGRTRWRLLGTVSRSGDGAHVACGEGTIGVRADAIQPLINHVFEVAR